MLKIGILGIGNAGGQVCSVAVKHGFDAICINASQGDLNTIDQNVRTVLLGDSLGCGQDRSIAKDFVINNINDLISLEQVNQLINENDIVAIVNSTGGGTGSGMGPIISDVLKGIFKQKPFINVGILPTFSQSVGAQKNTIEYLTEIDSFDATYMLYDNEKLSDRPVDEMMETINQQIVKDLIVIRGDYNFDTPHGMIDPKDTYKFVTLPGMIKVNSVFNFNEKMLDKKTLEECLINEIKNKDLGCEIDRDRIIKRMATIVNISPELRHHYDNSLVKFREFVGEPINTFEHFYVHNTEDEVNRISVIMAGLSMPDDRIKKIIQRIKEVEDRLMKQRKSSVLGSARESIGFLDDLVETDNGVQAGNAKDIVASVLDKYRK